MAFDRISAGLEAIVRSVLGPRLDYAAAWPARVVKQNADGSLDVQFDDTRWGGLQNLPIAYGVPGVAAEVAQGARVLVEYAGGRPDQPRVTLWDSASVSRLTVTAGDVVVNASTVELGSGTLQGAGLGATLASHLAALKAWADTLILPTAVGPAGPPTVPSPSVPTVESAHVKVIA